MTPNASAAVVDRVVERRRAVALARHYREFDGSRFDRSPIGSVALRRRSRRTSTSRPAGWRTVHARCVGVSRACGAYTQPRYGKGDAYSYGKACYSGRIARSGVGDAASRPLRRPRSAAAARSAIGHRAHFCAQSPVIHRYIQGSEVPVDRRQKARFAGISCLPGLVARVIRVGEVPGSNPGAPMYFQLIWRP
jgi:hypothetical protein